MADDFDERATRLVHEHECTPSHVAAKAIAEELRRSYRKAWWRAVFWALVGMIVARTAMWLGWLT